MELMDVNKKLKIGKIYSIHHKRKGHFVAHLIDVVEGDDLDPVFLTVKYDTRVGTDQHHLATQKGQAVRESNLRPSLIYSIEKTEEGGWLREIRVPTEEKVQEKQQGIMDRFSSLLGRN